MQINIVECVDMRRDSQCLVLLAGMFSGIFHTVSMYMYYRRLVGIVLVLYLYCTVLCITD